MRVYISGKMTYKKNFGREIFAQVAESLRALGHEVINPCETTEAKFGKDVLTSETGDPAHEKYHGVDRCEVIAQDLVNVCRSEMILMIGDDWHGSTGARAEHAAAVACNKLIPKLADPDSCCVRCTGTSIAKTYGGPMGYQRLAQAQTMAPMSQRLRRLVLDI